MFIYGSLIYSCKTFSQISISSDDTKLTLQLTSSVSKLYSFTCLPITWGRRLAALRPSSVESMDHFRSRCHLPTLYPNQWWVRQRSKANVFVSMLTLPKGLGFVKIQARRRWPLLNIFHYFPELTSMVIHSCLSRGKRGQKWETSAILEFSQRTYRTAVLHFRGWGRGFWIWSHSELINETLFQQRSVSFNIVLTSLFH